MERLTLDTRLGPMAVRRETVPGTRPIVFLHGVYFDHRLWAPVAREFPERTRILMDMPLHGESRTMARDWDLATVADALEDVLDGLEAPVVDGAGHSWGSMTLLRAASANPKRYRQLALCNMPLLPASAASRWRFRGQHLLLPWRSFYGNRVAEALYGKESLRRDPGLADRLRDAMASLSDHDVRTIDRRVILEADDARPLLEGLRGRVSLLRGREDYVPDPPGWPVTVVEGGHVSPLEVPRAVADFLREALAEA